jgi:hypothetical protein
LRDAADKITGQGGAWVCLRFAAAGQTKHANSEQQDSVNG